MRHGSSVLFSGSAWYVLACGLIASFFLFFWIYHLEQRNEQARFERLAHFRVSEIQHGMANAIDALEDINQLFVTNGTVSREQFHTFTKSLRARHPYIEAFAYHRRVSHADRPAFEAQLSKLYPGLTIGSMIDGKRVVAAVKDHYRVIDYVEPIEHARFIGLEESIMPFHDDAVHRADETGLPAATGLFRLYLRDNMSRGIRIAMAVYQGREVPEDVAARRQAVLGYTVIVLRARDLVEKILASSGTRDDGGVDMHVYADASPSESKLIYGMASAARKWIGPAWLPSHAPEPVSKSFDVAGTTWHIVASAVPAPFIVRHAGALFALFAGLLTTLAATVYLQSAGSRERRIQQLVAQRTEELKQVNEHLIEDIKARRMVEQALRTSEERARELAELSSDTAWEQDEHFRFTGFSTGGREESSTLPPARLGIAPWQLPIDPDSADWPAHRAALEAHQPFKNFEYKVLVDGMARWISSSGKPQFDAEGNFQGYHGTSRDITDRKLAEEGLHRSQWELRQLGAHRERIREDERKRIARDIHDELGQNLMVLRLDVSRMATHPEGVTEGQMAAALKQIDTTIKGIRTIINDLRPAVLDLGLHAAIQWQAKEFERRSGIPCDVHIDHEEFALDDQRATALFRSAQESLSNIIRHAHASQVWIGMHRKEDQLHIKIADNGIGAPLNLRRTEKAFGLIGIKERMYALGGTFSATSNPGQGMTIMLSIPIYTRASNRPRGTPVFP